MIKKLMIIGVLLVLTSWVQAQSSAPKVECGAILESEIFPAENGFGFEDFTLNVERGTTLNLTIAPIGTTFNPAFFLVDAGGSEITRVNAVSAGSPEELVEFQISSTNPVLRMYGSTPSETGGPNWPITSFPNDRWGKFFGAYEISLGCVLRDGTVINPGDAVPSPDEQPDEKPFSGVGFPGLPPIDFNNAVLIPFTAGVPNSGGIAPAFESVFGFTLEASAGDVFDLSVARVSGNLNLGVVVLSPDNKVVFYGGLITSESLSTRLTLPSAGQYTIGVFRVDLLPPDAPEATAFQVTGTLNP